MVDRAYGGGIMESDPQRRLALLAKQFHLGFFSGYAVNMMWTISKLGHVRVMAFVKPFLIDSLENFKCMIWKNKWNILRECITRDGAVSLDGLNMREEELFP